MTAAGSARYEIRVRGVLDPWTAGFEDLQVDSADRQTVITGPVADQAALRGLLNKVCDLGLVSVLSAPIRPRLIPAQPRLRSHCEEGNHASGGIAAACCRAHPGTAGGGQ